MSSARSISVFVKAWTGSGGTQLGDCPFCQRVLLMAALKRAPVETRLIDLDDKPQWFRDLAGTEAATTPVMVVEEEGAGRLVLNDSGDIVRWFQTQYPEPAVPAASAEVGAIGASVLPAFGKLIRNKDAAAEPALREALERELAQLDSTFAVSAGTGPFAGGLTQFGEHDCLLAPKLYHIVVGAPALKGIDVPGKFPHVASYLQACEAHDAWKSCAYPADAILDGWRKHLA